ncbi:MAG: phosphate ABC transporter permease subunit PstC [Acidobacteriota bacterium]
MQQPAEGAAETAVRQVPEPGPAAPARPQGRSRPGNLPDVLFRATTLFFAGLVLLLILAIGTVLFAQAHLAFSHFGWKFLWTKEWDPVQESFGALPSIFGTLVSSFLAILIAVPVSLGIAIFLTEMAPPWLQKPVGLAVEMLAAVPSIIYGMWGLFSFAPIMARHIEPWLKHHLGFLPLFQGPPMGIGMMTAAIILAVMIIPFINSITRDVFALVPAMAKESAYGLGATTWEVVRNVVIPYTRTGIVGAIFLGLGRALGETMAVTFVIGNAHDISLSLLSPSNTISSTLANEFTEATSHLYVSSLIALGLILFVITTIILSVAKLLLWRIERQVVGSVR